MLTISTRDLIAKASRYIKVCAETVLYLFAFLTVYLNKQNYWLFNDIILWNLIGEPQKFPRIVQNSFIPISHKNLC